MRRLASLFALFALLALTGCGSSEQKPAAPAIESRGIQDLDNVLALRSAFEADAGKTRVIILLSPT